MEDIDLFTCGDLGAALAACEPPQPQATDPLPEVVRDSFALGVDGALLLEHTVPHVVLPQLLRPLVGPFLAGNQITLRTSADASLCVRTVVDPECTTTGPYLRHLRNVTSAEANRLPRACVDVLRLFTTASMQASMRTLTLCECDHITTGSIRQLVALQQLTHLDVSNCPSLRPTALPHIAQLRKLEHLNITGMQKGRRPEVSAITIPDELSNLTHLRELCLGIHRLRSLAPLRPLHSLEKLSLHWARYPAGDLRHLAGLMHFHTLIIRGCAMNPTGLCCLPNLATLSVQGVRDLPTALIDEISRAPALTCLDLPDIRRYEPRTIFSIPTLTELSLSAWGNGVGAAVCKPESANLKMLNLSALVNRDTIAALRSFTALVDLTLGVRFTAGASMHELLSAVSSLPHLQRFIFSQSAHVDAAALRQLQACEHLTELELDCPESAYLEFLDVLTEFPNVRSLGLYFPDDASFIAEAAERLAGMPRLRELRALGAPEEDKHFVQLKLLSATVC